MDYILWLEVALFVFLMGLSGFFSSSETALFSLSGTRLEQMRRDQHPRVGLIERMLSQPRRLIITILIGNEFVNVAATAISATVMIETLGADKKWMNLFVMVPLLLVVGEITPKTLAIQHNVLFASLESYPIELFARLTKPLRWVVRGVADWFITLIVGKDRSRGNIITEDMVRTLAHEAVGEGALDSLEAQFIDHIFDFGNKTVEDVMVPRSSIFFLPLEMPVSQTLAELRRTRHTKVPIYQGRRDNIVGILHARDLLGPNFEKIAEQSQGLRKFLREPYFVPESKPALDLFHTFRKRRLSVALTVDEYGGVTGLVTMEDLLECIFGEIHSPSDVQQQVSIKPLVEGRYGVDAAIPIRVFNEEMGAKLPDEWGETIGGLILHYYGELPPEGATVEIGEFHFKVAEIRDNRIRNVEFEHAGEPEAAENERLECSDVETQIHAVGEKRVCNQAPMADGSRDGDKK